MPAGMLDFGTDSCELGCCHDGDACSNEDGECNVVDYEDYSWFDESEGSSFMLPRQLRIRSSR